jgi:hypothetical protein
MTRIVATAFGELGNDIVGQFAGPASQLSLMTYCKPRLPINEPTAFL